MSSQQLHLENLGKEDRWANHPKVIYLLRCDFDWASTSCRDCLSINAALALGKKTLNRYYDKADQSEVFQIAMDA